MCYFKGWLAIGNLGNKGNKGNKRDENKYQNIEKPKLKSLRLQNVYNTSTLVWTDFVLIFK